MPTEISDVYAYVDTSALAKLLKPEAETPAFELAASEWDGALVSSVILEPELRRVAVRYGLAQADCDLLLEGVTLIDIDAAIRHSTGALSPTELRALDAVHLATALAMGNDIGILFAYDHRLIEAASLHGVPTRAPTPTL